LIGRWPNDQSILEGRGETMARQHLMEIDSRPAISAPSTVSQSLRTSTQKGAQEGRVLMQFESIGENCEFGLVQRHFGVEPLGLLRWVSLAPDALCLALEERFEALDDVDDLEIRLIGPEYHAVGRRYRMQMHTHIVESEYKGSATQLKAQMFRRLRYLKDKLIADLTAAEKILVWQSGVGSSLSEDTVLRMHRAILAYGNNTVLVVRRHDDQRRGAVIDKRIPGLLVASLHQVDRVSGIDGKIRVASPFTAWLALCRQALTSRLGGSELLPT
jgi:hypothetical protein